jgi:transposase
MNKDITKFVGIDLGDRTSMAHVLNQAGEFEEETRLPTTAKALEREFRGRSRMRIAIEVGAHSRWVSRQLRGYGHEVIVADARKLRLIYQNPRKSDRVDATYLAKLVRLDESLLAPIRHRGETAQQHLALLRARESLVKARTQLVNHARGLVKSFGGRLPPCSTESFAKKARPAVPAPLRPALEPVLDSIHDLSARIRSYEQEVERLADEAYPETETMRQIKGVGALTALAFVLTLEDPGRFSKSREVGPCLGLVPKRDQSGDQDPERHITKTGDPYLRRLLIGSAHYILGPFGQDSHLRTWGLRLAARGGKNAKKRAAVAVARKLGVLLHKLWVSGEDFVPFYPARGQTAPAEELRI